MIIISNNYILLDSQQDMFWSVRAFGATLLAAKKEKKSPWQRPCVVSKVVTEHILKNFQIPKLPVSNVPSEKFASVMGECVIVKL